jgi:hypothetical protein
MENFKYVVKKSGFITLKGSSINISVGQEVSKFVYECYPNFVNRIRITEPIVIEQEPIVEELKTEPIIIEEELELEPVVEDNKKNNKKKK